MSVERYKELIEKKATESSALKDFVSGIDPSGTSTFNNALDNEQNHKKHRAIGDAGGFVGGVLGGALAPAALAGGAALAIKKKNPETAKTLMTTAKGSLDALNPKKVVSYAKAMPEIMKLQTDAGKATKGLKHISDGFDKIKSGKARPGDLKNMVSGAIDAVKSSNYAKDESKKIAEKHFNGMSFGEGAGRATTALTTLGTAAAGGALNAGSAHIQYDTALKAKNKLRNQNKEEDQNGDR